MGKVIAVAAAALLLVCCVCAVRGEDSDAAKASVVRFLLELAGGNDQVVRDLRWVAATAPCGGAGAAPWAGVNCTGDKRIKQIVLERLPGGLNGTINAALLCAATELAHLSLMGNQLRGSLPADIAGCSKLDHLYVHENQLSGSLPDSLARLNRLVVLDVSRNGFSGEIPGGLSKIDDLRTFMANDNQFTGAIPDFNLTKFKANMFNVSNNRLAGPIPENTGDFGDDSFLPNAGLCGELLDRPCPPAASPLPGTSLDTSPPGSDRDGEGKRKTGRARDIVMYLGYVLLGAGILAFVVYMLCSRKRYTMKMGRKPKGGGNNAYEGKATPTTTASATSKSAYSLPTSAEQRVAPSASLVVLRRSGTASLTTAAAAAAAKELRFEDLLKSPAELLGRGRFGSSYKVVVAGVGAALAVKRVKDAAVGEEVFRRRMERVGRARHPAVLPPLAFYCAMQEKLVVYEFQSNGSLAKLLHGSIESSQGALDWPTRLYIAAKVADGMAFMHEALCGDGGVSNWSSGDSSGGAIAHGNLKASNVLFTAGMEPCVSEYGVTAPPPHLPDGGTSCADVRAFGVLLLELLTGKATASQGDGSELARWVTSVIREEWTAEVFDRALLVGGAEGSEQRMVQLLQVAMKCVDTAPPPTMREVAAMVIVIRDEDDRSLSSEASMMT